MAHRLAGFDSTNALSHAVAICELGRAAENIRSAKASECGGSSSSRI